MLNELTLGTNICDKQRLTARVGLSKLREKVRMFKTGAETGRLQALHPWPRVCQGRPEELGAYAVLP